LASGSGHALVGHGAEEVVGEGEALQAQHHAYFWRHVPQLVLPEMQLLVSGEGALQMILKAFAHKMAQAKAK